MTNDTRPFFERAKENLFSPSPPITGYRTGDVLLGLAMILSSYYAYQESYIEHLILFIIEAFIFFLMGCLVIWRAFFRYQEKREDVEIEGWMSASQERTGLSVLGFFCGVCILLPAIFLDIGTFFYFFAAVFLIPSSCGLLTTLREKRG